MKKKSIAVATILSIIFPGLGHLYLNKYIRAVIFIVLDIVCAFLPYAGIFMIIVWIISVFDANRILNSINKNAEL